MRQYGENLKLRARLISLYGGVITIVLWTLLRHISNGVNFDIVGQVGLANQWQNGLHDGAVLGPTNYLLKLPIYMLINWLQVLSPMSRLLILATLFNVFTYIGLFLLYEKFARLNGRKLKSYVYFSSLWLAVIAGNIFWMDYANSRNLEALGGMFFLYLILRYLRESTKRGLIIISLAGSLVFFADVLQFYICGLGAIIFLALKLARNRNHVALRRFANVSAAILAGYAGSKILFFLARKFLHVSFLAVPQNKFNINFNSLTGSLKGTAHSTLNIFGADFFNHYHGPNLLRHLINFLALLIFIRLVFGGLRAKSKNSDVKTLLFTALAANYLIYLLSGQALQPNTSRYLIMVPILFLGVAALGVPDVKKAQNKYLKLFLASFIAISVLLIAAATVKAWPQRHSKDAHIYQLSSYMNKNKYNYALGTPGIGIVTNYFVSSNQAVLPISCPGDGTLREVTLFYDKANFKVLNKYQGDIPIIVEPGPSHGYNLCDRDALIRAIGKPKREDIVPEVGSAEIYDVAQVKIAPGKDF